MRATFAHGLWSSPDSGKAEWLRSHGWEVHALDMRQHGWDQASQTRVVLEAIDEMGPFDVLIGSSFGGLATANAAALRPEEDLRLVLLAPAFWLPRFAQG
jgi:pimeloyl-ACP methyl ester carboxylesterase